MNKIKQIEALVEEAIEKIEKAGLKDFRNFRKLILTDLAKRSAEIAKHDLLLGLMHNRLQPSEVDEAIIKTHDTQPREWWMDLQKGDKFIFDNKATRSEETFDGTLKLWKGNLYLNTEEDTTLRLEYCSPYTDPTQTFRDKLSPELQQEFDKLTIK